MLKETIVRHYYFAYKNEAEAFLEKLKQDKRYSVLLLYLNVDYSRNWGYKLEVELTRKLPKYKLTSDVYMEWEK